MAGEKFLESSGSIGGDADTVALGAEGRRSISLEHVKWDRRVGVFETLSKG